MISHLNKSSNVLLSFCSLVVFSLLGAVASGQETKETTDKQQKKQEENKVQSADKAPPKNESAQENKKGVETKPRDKATDPNIKNASTKGKLFWVFLTTGKPTEGLPPEEVAKMQKEHLANFRRLMEDGKLLTAGPMTDPDGLKRGIVILKAAKQADLAAMFKSDPYVQNGILKIESCEMKFELGQIRTKLTPQGMDEYRMVILERNVDSKTKMDDALAAETLKYLKGEYTNKSLNLSLKLFGDKTLCRHILIFKKADDESKITEIVAAIPAVKLGVWRQKTMPLYMGKGSIDRDDE